jgi:TPR repeat protein
MPSDHNAERQEHIETKDSNQYSEAELKDMRDGVERLQRELELLENPDTICSFGDAALDGDGVEQNYTEAANWYRIAAEKGSSRAQHNLGVMYEEGTGFQKDTSEAAKWYRLAAEQDNPGSQNNLGRLYETGDGVPQDQAVALEWYSKAAAAGDANAQENVKRLRDRVELLRHRKLASDFIDLMAADPPYIGDCALLPAPKSEILYALQFVMHDYETCREATADPSLITQYDKAVENCGYLITRLARDWQPIAPEDKHAIANLNRCATFPDWALPLKRKYINDERGSDEACSAAFQVLKDQVAKEKADSRASA